MREQSAVLLGGNRCFGGDGFLDDSGLAGRRRLQVLPKAGRRRRGEEVGHRNARAVAGLYSTEQLDHKQGMPAGEKEIVLRTDFVAEQFGEQHR